MQINFSDKISATDYPIEYNQDLEKTSSVQPEDRQLTYIIADPTKYLTDQTADSKIREEAPSLESRMVVSYPSPAISTETEETEMEIENSPNDFESDGFSKFAEVMKQEVEGISFKTLDRIYKFCQSNPSLFGFKESKKRGRSEYESDLKEPNSQSGKKPRLSTEEADCKLDSVKHVESTAISVKKKVNSNALLCDGLTLQDLPPEIIILILQKMDLTAKDWASLSRTNSFFNKITKDKVIAKDLLEKYRKNCSAEAKINLSLLINRF